MEKSQQESLPSSTPRFDGRKLAETIAAVHGTVPVVITGKPFDPAVAELLRKFQKARAVPSSDTFRCKN